MKLCPGNDGRGWLVAAVALAAFVNALGNGFTFDDHYVVVENPAVTDTSRLWQSFTTDSFRGHSSGLVYRPLTVLTFGLNRVAHGMRPWGFHLVNIALHAVVSWLAYRLIRRLSNHATLALVAGLLFAAHPIHADAVASVVGRAELLVAMFALLAVWFYLDDADPPQPRPGRRFVWCLLCFFGACLSKENGITVPALIAVTELAVCLARRDWSRFRGRELRQTLLRYAALAGVAGAYLAVRYAALGIVTLVPEQDPSRTTVPGLLLGWPWHLQFLNALHLFARYLGLLFWPARLSCDYSFNQIPLYTDPWHWEIGVGATALVALIGIALLSIRRAPMLFFGIAFFFLAFLPVSNFVIPIMTILAERAMYLPSVGFAVAMGVVIEAVARRGRWENAVRVGLTAALVLPMTARTIVRNRDWRNDLRLFESAVEVCPNSADMRGNYAHALAREGRIKEALTQFDAALAILPTHGQIWYARGKALLRGGHREEAMRSFLKAAEFAPLAQSQFLQGDVCDQISRLHLASGNLDEARSWALRAIESEPDRAVFRYNLGYVAHKQGDVVAAIEHYREAVRLDPREPSFAFNLGLMLRDAGDLDGAFTQLERATELDPENEKYWQALGDVLLKKGALAPAALALEQFIRLSTNETMVAKAREILAQIRK